MYVNISNTPKTMYIRFTAFWNFSKLLCVLHILGFYEISTPVMRTMPTMANNVSIIISDIAHNV